MLNSKQDLLILIGTAIIWLYITVNLNTILGLIYVAMIYFYWNKDQSGQVYPIIKGRPKLTRVLGIALIIAFVWIYLVSEWVGSIAPAIPLEKLQKMFAIVEKPMHPYMSLFITGLLIPVTEEMFFRGAIMPFLSRRVKMTGILLLITSAAFFGIWHLMAYQAENMAMISGFLFGLLVSYITVKRGQLIEAITIHAILNTIVMLSSLGFLGLVI